MRPQKAEQILDIAERMTRAGGYGGFSFRDIANEVGIKSASVHYHFPTKEDLGAAMAERYTDRFVESLGDPRDENRTTQDKLDAYAAAFRHALVEDDLMCLCGVLGAEISGLPERVAQEAQRFFDRNRDWLAAVYEADPSFASDEAREAAALAMIAKLEGAMLVARAMDDKTVFDRVMSAK